MENFLQKAERIIPCHTVTVMKWSFFQFKTNQRLLVEKYGTRKNEWTNHYICWGAQGFGRRYKRNFGEDFLQCRACRWVTFPRGFVISEWLLCQSVRESFLCWVTVFLIRLERAKLLCKTAALLWAYNTRCVMAQNSTSVWSFVSEGMFLLLTS